MAQFYPMFAKIKFLPKVKHPSILLFVWLLCITAMAQSFRFKPLSAQGPVPDDFTKDYYSKMQKEIERLEKSKDLDKKEEIHFHQMNEFLVDRYMTTGKVIYGDEITIYLNKVLDKVLEKHQSLRRELRVYAVRSADFNAYTTNNGIIFVNMGLLAELATEAQLAYVLAHEIVHYVENHVRKDYDFKGDILQNRSTFDDNTVAVSKSYYSFSKEHEIEADQKGYTEYFAHTGYSKLAPFELMEIMLYSYLPFDEIEFDINILNSKHYGISNLELREFEAQPISARDDVSDAMSTHPNIKKRTEALYDFLRKKKEGSDFLVSETDFYRVRDLARFESLDDYLRTARFDRAIYQAFLLMKKYPDDDYLKRAIVFAIYGTSVYKNYFELPPYVKNMKGVEGELSRVRNILKKIEPESLNILAVAKTYEYYKLHPDDLLAKRMYQDAMWELTHFHNKKLTYFDEMPAFSQTEAGDSTANTKVPEAEVEMKTTGKVKRLKENKKESQEFFDAKYAFSSYLEDTSFTNYFLKLASAVQSFNENQLPRVATKSNKKGDAITLQELRKRPDLFPGEFFVYPEKKRNLGGQGIYSAFVITPEIYSLKTRQEGLNYKKSAQSLNYFVNDLQQSANNLGMNLEIFDYKLVDDSDRFNDMQLLQLWYDERNEHKNVDMVTYMFDRIHPLCDKYNTSHLLASGSVSVNTKGMKEFERDVQKAGVLFSVLIGSAVFFPAAPFITGTALMPTQKTFQYMRVIDLKTDKVVYYRSLETKQIRSRSNSKALMYNQLNEISSKPKYAE